MSWYAVYLEPCPECGGSHRYGGQHRIDHGPTEEGTLARLYPDGNYPSHILGEWIVVCDETEVSVRVIDPAAVRVRPLPPGVRSFVF